MSQEGTTMLCRRNVAVSLAILSFGCSAAMADEEKESGEFKLMLAIKPTALQIFEKDDPLLKLNKQRLRAATKELDIRYKEFTAGRGTQEFLFKALNRVIESASDVLAEPGTRLPVVEAAAEMARDIEAIDMGRFAAGRISEQDLAAAQYERATAEARLLRLKRELDKQKK